MKKNKKPFLYLAYKKRKLIELIDGYMFSDTIKNKKIRKLTALIHILFLILSIPITLALILLLCMYILSLSTSDVFSFLTSIGTIILAIITTISVQQAIRLSGDNVQKNKQDSFEKTFSLLLDQHNSLLNKIIETQGLMLNSKYILSLPGDMALQIIRGDNNKLIIDKNLYLLNDNKIFIYHEPVSKKNISIANLLSYSFINDSSSYFCEDKFNELNEIDTPNIINVIRNENDISINLLSPYMRIIYHILKLIKSHYGKDMDNAKKYTNIIRSVIPNNILILIAINSMFFYTARGEEDKSVYSFLKNYEEVTNDYYKYYALLSEYDFFEHLKVNEDAVIKNNKYEQMDLSINKFNSINHLIVNNESAYILGKIDYNYPTVYLELNKNIRKMNTEFLIFMFYIKNTNKYTIEKTLMSGFIKSNTAYKGSLKTKFPPHISVAYENHNVIIINKYFWECFFSGKLLKIIK